MALECMFSNDYAVDLSYQGNISIAAKTAPESGYTLIAGPYKFSPNTTVKSECNSGKDGQTLIGSADSAIVNFNDHINVENGKQALLFPTNYTGLFYTVQIKVNANDCSDIAGYIPPDIGDIPLFDAGDRDRTCMDGNSWIFFVSFYIGKKFKQPKSKTSFSSELKAHGKFRISGTDGDLIRRIVQISLVKTNGSINPK